MRRTHLKLGSIAVISIGSLAAIGLPSALASCPHCDCTPCWELQEGDCMEAGLCHEVDGECQDPIEVCNQATSPVLTPAEWADYFDIGYWIEDRDLRKNYWWVPDCRPGGECHLHESGWFAFDDPWVRLHHWDFVLAPPDLRHTGSYMLKAYFKNDLIPDPVRCPNPCWCPDGTENCADCQRCPERERLALPDPETMDTIIIKVKDCCGCQECYGTISGWLTVPNPHGDCPPGVSWEGDIMEDTCDPPNTLQLTCSGAYHLKYNGADVGTCIWRCGQNLFAYKIRTMECGWRFWEIFHRTHDNYPAVYPCNPGTDHETWHSCDCGTPGMYDSLITRTQPCFVGPPVLPNPQCCASQDTPSANPDANTCDSNSTGICEVCNFVCP